MAMMHKSGDESKHAKDATPPREVAEPSLVAELFAAFAGSQSEGETRDQRRAYLDNVLAEARYWADQIVNPPAVPDASKE